MKNEGASVERKLSVAAWARILRSLLSSTRSALRIQKPGPLETTTVDLIAQIIRNEATISSLESQKTFLERSRGVVTIQTELNPEHGTRAESRERRIYHVVQSPET